MCNCLTDSATNRPATDSTGLKPPLHRLKGWRVMDRSFNLRCYHCLPKQLQLNEKFLMDLIATQGSASAKAHRLIGTVFCDFAPFFKSNAGLVGRAARCWGVLRNTFILMLLAWQGCYGHNTNLTPHRARTLMKPSERSIIVLCVYVCMCAQCILRL